MEGTCGCTEQLATRAEARAALQTNRPRYFIEATPPGHTTVTIAAAIEAACKRWTDAGVNVTIIRAVDRAEIGPGDVCDFIETAALGPGVLADQTLGNGQTTRHRMRISTRIDWSRTDLVTVLAHELGHLWGLAHFPDGPPPELMEARLGSITNPQPTEVAVARDWFKRFPPIGPAPEPEPAPAPTPNPFPPDCCFRIRNNVLLARLPMPLSSEQQVKVQEARRALGALDCQTVFAALWQAFLDALCRGQPVTESK